MQRLVLPPLVAHLNSVAGRGSEAVGAEAAASPPRILELACGTGRLGTFVRDNLPYAEYHAVDLSPFYLERARANFLAIESFERESVSGMASKLGHFHVLGGDFRSEERYFESVRLATPEDLQRVAGKQSDEPSPKPAKKAAKRKQAPRKKVARKGGNGNDGTEPAPENNGDAVDVAPGSGHVMRIPVPEGTDTAAIDEFAPGPPLFPRPAARLRRFAPSLR